MAKEPKKIKKVKGTEVVKKAKSVKVAKVKKKEVAEVNTGDSLTGVVSGLVTKPVVTEGYQLKGQNYDNVAPQDLAEFSQAALREYGSYVVEDRAVADFRDGLKPSHRAIIWSMCDLGLRSNAGHKKAARTVGQGIGMYHPHGDCLGGETILYCLDGVKRTFKEIYESGIKELDVLSLDESTGKYVAAKAHSFRIGQHATKIYHITLSDGSTIRATGNHPFFVRKEGWVKAENLEVGQPLEGGSINLDARYRTLKQVKGKTTQIFHITGPDVEDGFVRHHENHNRHDDRPENIVSESRASHAKHHEDYKTGLEEGRKTMQSSKAWREAMRKKNSALITAHNKALPILKALKALAIIAEAGAPLTTHNYRIVQSRGVIYNLTNLETLETKYDTDFDQLLDYYENGFKIDTSAAKGHTEGLVVPREAQSRTNSIMGRVRQNQLSCFARVVDSIVRAELPLNWKSYKLMRELCIEETGLGFGNIKGRSYPSKRTMRKHFGDLKFKRLVKIATRRAHTLFIRKIEVVEQKAEPMYDFTVDKYENAIILTKGKTEGRSTFVVAHNSSLYGAMVTIANTIPPAVDGQGNWGTPTDGAAAMRYTESKLSIFASMFLVDRKYLEVVPMVANYSNDGKIPLYMPALLPYLLFNGSVPAPAYGVKAGNPTFSFESVANTVIRALEGKEVDSKYLQKNLKIEHEYGCDNVTSPEEFKALVETGRGRVTYRGRVSVDVKNRIIVIHTFVPAGFASSATINKTLEKLSLISGVSKAYSNCGLKNKDAGAWGAAYEVKCGRVSEDRLYEIARDVERQVTNSVSYALGVTIRKESDANEFRYLDYVKYFKAWVTYRLKLEVRLNKDLKEKAEREKHILEVYLFAVDNIKKLLAALPKVLSSADPDKMLAKTLKMDVEDAKIILDRQVRKLAKLERDDLVKAINKLKADIKQYSTNIKDPGTAAAIDTKARVSAYLKNLDKHPYNAKEKIFCYRPENQDKKKTKKTTKKSKK